MRPTAALFLTLFLGILGGCPKTLPPPSPAPEFEACGQRPFTIEGSIGVGTNNVSAQGTLDESSTSVEWNTPPNTSDSGNMGIDDASASGTSTFDETTNERRFNASGENSGYTVNVAGTINLDCTGSGTWEVVNDSGKKVGSGTWSMP